MRAYLLPEYTGPDALRLTEIPEPRPALDELVVDVRAIGVNFPDLLFCKGLYQHRPEVPVVPGCEIAGYVAEAPAGSGWQAGDRLAAFVWHGGFAERALVPLPHAVHVPDTVSLEKAAAGLVNNHTAHFALLRRAGTRPGETVLVLGAAGGVGTAAIQVARGLRAKVIAGVSRPERASVARAAGAEDVVVLSKGFAGHVKELTGGRGVDVVVDPVGDWLFHEALRALAPEGRLIVIGFAAGDIPEVKVNRLLLRNISVMGVAFGGFIEVDPTVMQTQAVSLDNMAARGVINPPIGSRFVFQELPEALRQLDEGAVAGKAVVLLDGSQ
jgi:NADPH:quinone reductase